MKNLIIGLVVGALIMYGLVFCLGTIGNVNASLQNLNIRLTDVEKYLNANAKPQAQAQTEQKKIK